MKEYVKYTQIYEMKFIILHKSVNELNQCIENEIFEMLNYAE